MATYKPYRKTDKAGTLEEIKIPYSSVDGTPTIPTKTSQLTNDSGFITSAPANYTTSSRSPSQCTANGFYYVSSSVNSLTDANGNPFLQYHTSNNDFRILVTAYSDSWVQQIATDFRSTHIYYRIRNNGTWGAWTEIAKISDIPTVNNATLTIQKNGTNVQTFTANQSSSVTANITVPTKASDVNALSLDGGTINKSKTVKMDASANSNGANLKWGTVNSKNPYIGYASDQVDGTFVVGSLLGTNYASGLAIGGGSGNLLWKGTKVATTNDIPNVSGKANLSGGNIFTGNQYVRNGWIGDESGFCAFNYTGAHPELNITDNALVGLDNGYGEDGQVFTSQGETGPPHWTSMPTYSLSGTTLTITLP